MTTLAPRPAAAVFAAVLCAVAGCGASRDCTLTGKVTSDGKPVIYGTVIAQCADGTRLATNIQPDGSYKLERLLAGPVKLGVASPEPPDAAQLAAAAGQPNRPAGPPPNLKPVDKSRWFKIDETYSDPEKTGKSTTVASGNNQFDIQLP